MPKKFSQPRGVCQFCGQVFAKSASVRHHDKCEKRLQAIASARQATTTIWLLRVESHNSKQFWLDIEMRGDATLEKLDQYLRAIWLECCGHLSQFMIGSWMGREVRKGIKADHIFQAGEELTHVYDYGTTSETAIRVIAKREGSPCNAHPIALLTRNVMPEYKCQDCENTAAYLCVECLIEGGWNQNYYLCEEHMPDHPHEDYGEPIPVVNSPRMGMCGYSGPADPPY